jgi:hypothetical protein
MFSLPLACTSFPSSMPIIHRLHYLALIYASLSDFLGYMLR